MDTSTEDVLVANTDSLNRTLFISDNLPILRGIDSGSVDLIATDPPFNKGVKAFEGIVAAGVDPKGRKVSYKDVWTWGDVQSEWTEKINDDHPNLHAVIQAANAAAGEEMGAFLCWLGVRVLEMHRILKPTGSLPAYRPHGPRLGEVPLGRHLRAGALSQCNRVAQHHRPQRREPIWNEHRDPALLHQGRQVGHGISSMNRMTMLTRHASGSRTPTAGCGRTTT